jgi:glutathione S-transferase
LSTRSYVAGEAPTIADLSIASNLDQLGLAGAAPTTPAIGAWSRKMNSLEGVRKSCAAMKAAMAG